MKDYIAHRLSKIPKGASAIEQKKVLEDIYRELESKGFQHYEIFILINEVVCSNLHELRKKLWYYF